MAMLFVECCIILGAVCDSSPFLYIKSVSCGHAVMVEQNCAITWAILLSCDYLYYLVVSVMLRMLVPVAALSKS